MAVLASGEQSIMCVWQGSQMLVKIRLRLNLEILQELTNSLGNESNLFCGQSEKKVGYVPIQIGKKKHHRSCVFGDLGFGIWVWIWDKRSCTNWDESFMAWEFQ